MKSYGKLFWTFIRTADTKYGQWKTTLVTDREEAAKLRDIGLKVRRVDEMQDGEDMAAAGDYKVKFTRYLEGRGKAKGKMNPQPKQALLQSDGTKVEYTGIVGNGSSGWVVFTPYEWANKEGWGADLSGVIVENLIEFESEGGGDVPRSEADSEFDDMVAAEPEESSTPETPPTPPEVPDEEDDDEW